MYQKPPSKLLPLPASHEKVLGLYWRPTPAFIEEVAAALAGQRVLEVFAGNGYLAGVLAQRGIDVVATSVLSSIDAHERGIYHSVTEINAVAAVSTLGEDRDVLLMCWPTVTDQAVHAAELWGERAILFIGEYTDYSLGHLGGTATDEFFERFSVTHTFASYRGSAMEKACMGVLLPPEQARDGARLAWQRNQPRWRS